MTRQYHPQFAAPRCVAAKIEINFAPMIELRVEKGGERLDRYLAAALPNFSRARLQNLIRQNFVTLNEKTARPRHLVRAGDLVQVREPKIEKIDAAPEEIALDIIFEDVDLIVINKPPGLVVHPGAGHQSSTLVNALLHHCQDLSGIGGKERPGIVHRLDKETSGCLVVAKNDAAHENLSAQFAARTVEKIYLALVAGTPTRSRDVIDAAIARHPVHRKKMAIARERGRAARTEYRVLSSSREFSLVECVLHSGRTHQIRVHFQHIGHPVLGDKMYGGKSAKSFLRQMLHAWKLGFAHPRSDNWKKFVAPLPEDFAAAITPLNWTPPAGEPDVSPKTPPIKSAAPAK